ncbi:DNA endonuclease RBBP8-like [Canis lupus familiaris]|uniref:DNA endonuclease RBBP8-like n=1 Tax=Canis lupus familiaris TaxID=9615 RepID=UPI0003AE37A8|nr:DNA endonuclease RBBP8-like [Canis lupus familiaris]XP_035567387.1 DNA endonuclease RBBP8-like [Canis lupus dingo]XP_038306631.1 DNA endonuclease RBBP8-like [Canis lupus familiaris]XP_038444080.1 DNA endonuclease RBBP8-like [Canis lupus familiaris]XP_048963838.1 DNA endonuclease RBBP8-like [Canis lupus dingo]|eukprot:XP_022271279.1 DNA endonuclease RBBP8-like [Canis lupus familiaris]
MQKGNMGGGDRGSGKKPSVKDKLRFSVCDVSSDEFKKTWLALKELHDRELHRLQAKLATLRKERLADGRWTGSIAKIKELTEQQKVLNSTIRDLRNQLNAKVCDRCSMNETYRNTLQQEFYDIQQQNLQFIAELTAERNKLREENKKLSEKLRLNQQQFQPSFSFSDSDDDDFIPCTQRSVQVFSVKEPAPSAQMHLPIQMRQSNTEQIRSGRKKERRQSPKFAIPFYSQDLFEEPQISPEISSNSSKPAAVSSTNQKSTAAFPLTSTLDPQSGDGFQDVSDLHEDKLGQPKRKHIITQKTSTQKCETHIDFSWSLSSISAENPTTQVISETSEENMPDYNKSSLSPFTSRKEKPPLTVFPFDYTLKSNGKRRLKAGTAYCNNVFSVRDCSNQTLSTEQSVKKNSNESTSTEYGAYKPPSDTQSLIFESVIKRKAKIQSGKREK